MNSVPVQKKNLSRGFWLIIIILCVLVFGGTGLWYFAAGKLDETITQIQQKLAKSGQIITCDNREIRGYPFRLGLFCDHLEVDDKRRKQMLTSGALRTAAQIYDPGKLILEIDGPAQFTDTRLGLFTANWQSLRASMRASLDGIQRTSVASRVISIKHEGNDAPLLKAEMLDIHARKSGENNLDVAVLTQKLAIADIKQPKNGMFKPFDLSTDITGNEVFNVVQNRQSLISHLRQNGGNGLLNAFKLTTPTGGVLEVSGPISVNLDGELSGKLNVSIDKLGELIAYFREALPFPQSDMDQFVLATKIASSNGAAPKFQIQITNGEIFLGLFSLGRLQPIF